MSSQCASSVVVVTAPRKRNLDAPPEFLQDQVCDIPPTNPIPKPDPCKSLIPPPKTVLNYKIDQIETKLKKKVCTGVAQLHLTQTKAVYQYPPLGYVFPEDEPETKKPFGKGNPPIWVFEEEKWWERIQRRQEVHKRKFLELRSQNLKFARLFAKRTHEKVLRLAGPEWFQELSPQQLKTVDQLKTCILKDKKQKSIIHTKENMTELGLMNRPKEKHIKIALDSCCECPVEFLLILYQLMNKKRTKYSINDRLLLSGVVHLTIRETLKELHIRIPSPPPQPPPDKVPMEFPKRKKYKSPYLEPFDFEPCPRKHTGIYKNTQIQYPESPYFSYVAELRNEMKFKSNRARENYIKKMQSGITEDEHKEIVGELKTAQNIYKELTEVEKVPYLLKPSIYIPCDHGIVEKEEEKQSVPVAVEVKVTTDDDLDEDVCKKVCQCNVTVHDGNIPVPSKESLGEFVDACSSKESSTSTTLSSQLPPIPEQQEEEESSKKISNECTCREEAEKVIQENSCQCYLCQQNKMKNHESSTAANGSVETKSEETNLKKCDCLERYHAQIRQYEEMRHRFVVQQRLSLQPDQYVIEGVTRGVDGQPVYMLGGVLPEYECSCAKAYHEYLKDQERLANMPHLPPGKQKYIVSGVHPTAKGNVFVLDGALPKEMCACQKLFKSYEQRHNVCLDLYEKFVEKTEADVNEYIHELKDDPRFDQESVRSLKSSNKSDHPGGSISSYKDNRRSKPITESDKHSETSTTTTSDDDKSDDDVCPCCCKPESVKASDDNMEYQITCPCCNPSDPADTCSCNDVCDVDQSELECTCGDEELEEEVEEEEEEVPLHRYTILKKIPCKYKEQVEILKSALAVMADDGFPLPKLPDSWKLPIFKLWMQLRCGRYFTQENRVKMFNKSVDYWSHIDQCKTMMHQTARLGMPHRQADKYTWRHAHTVRKIALTKETSYYREVKQIAINEGREFFPTTFSYELPNPTFRDCFFAYLPGKEDSCTYWRPWYTHEYKSKR